MHALSVPAAFWLGCAFAVALALQVHFVNVTFDDAYISFRYARNFAHGDGLVFNVGERVEGYSNFTWTLLLGLAFRLGIDRWEFGPLVLSKVVGSALCFASLLVLVRTAWGSTGSVPPRRGWQLPLLYVAASAPAALWTVGALETPLVTFLIALFVYWYLLDELEPSESKPLVSRASLVLLAAALTRPEPVSLFAAVMLFRIVDGLRARTLVVRYPEHLRFAGTFLVPYVAHLGFRLAYYGEILPNTYYAKVYRDPLLWTRGTFYFEDALGDLGFGVLAAVGVIPILLGAGLTRRFVFLACVAAAQLLAGVSEGGDWMPGYRLYVPALPVIGLLMQESFVASVRLLERGPCLPQMPRWLEREERLLRIWGMLTGPWARRLRWPRVSGAVARPLGALTFSVVIGLSAVRSFQSIGTSGVSSGFAGLKLDTPRHFEVGRWMRAHITDKGLLAIGEAGIIPYYSDLPVLDMFGLVDRHIARLPGIRHHKFDIDYVLSRKPTYVLLMVSRTPERKVIEYTYGKMLVEDSRFSAQYEVVHEFDVAELFRRRAF